MVKDDSSVLCL